MPRNSTFTFQYLKIIVLLLGFGVGLGVGLLGCGAMICTGVFTGLGQIGMGMYYTPEAVKATYDGKEWDKEKRE